MNFLASPAIVTAMAFSGKLSFNPVTDTLSTPSGKVFKFTPPTGTDLPQDGFTIGDEGYYPAPTPAPQPERRIIIAPESDRLQTLSPFSSHFGPQNSRGLELPKMRVLMRVRGKCTTDHISAAGPWLKYKGHLENISKNLRESLYPVFSPDSFTRCSDHGELDLGTPTGLLTPYQRPSTTKMGR
jgi:homoaconitase